MYNSSLASMLWGWASIGLVALGQSIALGSIQVTPSWTPSWTASDTDAINSLAELELDFNVDLPSYIAFLYKSDFVKNVLLGTDSGDYGGDYNTAFDQLDDEGEPTGGTVMHVTGNAFIDLPEVYLIVKDGNADPAQWLFDISGWNGTEDIELSGFWDGPGPAGAGAISHVQIWGGDPNDPPGGGVGDVPEPMSIAVWSLLAGIVALVSSRRRK